MASQYWASDPRPSPPLNSQLWWLCDQGENVHVIKVILVALPHPSTCTAKSLWGSVEN